jgi:hypothetical protein
MLYGLKIQVDFETGKRAGNIDPRDRGLACHPTWQNIDVGYEVRLIVDGRDVAVYENVPGIEILYGENVINAEVQAMQKDRYTVKNEALLVESIKQKGIDISDIPPDLSPEEEARELYLRGALGIVRYSPNPPTAAELYNKFSTESR